MNITWLHTTRTIVGRTLALGLIVVAVGCASDTRLTTAPELLDAEGEFILLPEDGYTLTGVITDAETGDPLARVRVRVSQPGRVGFHATMTGADGRYEVVGVTGLTTVRVSLGGFEIDSRTVDIDADGVLDFDLSEEGADDDEEDDRGL